MKLKKLLKKYTPSIESISENGAIRLIHHLLLGQNIWHLNRRSVSCAVFIGIFCAMLPVPGQMLFALAFALILRAHLPLSIAVTWITNPITYMPIFYFNYRLGVFMSGGTEEIQMQAFALTAFYENIHSILIPLFIGSITTGLTIGFVGLVLVRLYWRYNVLHYWRRRKEHRQQKHQR